MARLHVSIPNKGETTIELVDQTSTIGRKPDNHVQIDDGSVSAHHAQIIRNNGQYFLRDLDSMNKTWINGNETRAALLTGSCLIRFGLIDCIFKDESANSPSDAASKQLRGLLKQAEALLAVTGTYEKKFESQLLQIKLLERERDSANTNAEAANSSMVQLKQLVAGTEKKLEDAAAKDQARTAAEEALRTDLGNLTRERNSVMERAQKLTEQLNQTHAQIAVFSQLQDQKWAREETGKALAYELNAALKERNASKAAEKQTTEKLTQLDREFKQLAEERDDLRSQYDELSGNLNSLGNKLIDAKNSLERSQKERDKFAAKLKESEEALHRVNQNSQSLQADREELKAAFENQRKELQSLQKQLAERENMADQTAANLLQASLRIEQLSNTEAELRIQIEAAKKTSEQLHAKPGEFEIQNQSLWRGGESMQNQNGEPARRSQTQSTGMAELKDLVAHIRRVAQAVAREQIS